MKIENVGIAWDAIKKQDNCIIGDGEIDWKNGTMTDISFRYDETHHTCEITCAADNITHIEKVNAENILLENIETNLWEID